MPKEKLLRKVFVKKFIFILIIPIIFIGGIIISLTTQTLNKEINSKYELLVKLFTTELKEELLSINESLALYKDIVELLIDNKILMQDYLDRLIQNKKYVESIQVIDSGGIIRYLSPFDSQLYLQDMSGYNFYQKVTSLNKIFWSPSFIYQQKNYPGCTLSIPFNRGILTLYLDLSTVVESIKHIKIPEGSYYGVVDQTGVFILNSMKEKVSRREREKHYNTIESKNNESLIKFTIEEENIIYNVQFITEPDWAVILYQPLDELNKETTRNILFLLTFSLFVMIIAGIFSSRLITPVTKALSNLIKNTKEISLGNYDHPLENGIYKEFSQLAKQFNIMAGNIKERERNIIESEEKVRRILEASPDAITVTDIVGNFTECNAAALKLFGFTSKKDIFKINVMDLFMEEDRQKAMINREKTLKRGFRNNCEYTLKTTGGKTFKAELSASVIHNIHNKPIGFISITKDITKRKKIEEERELLIRQMEDKQKELEQFTYTVSHDLRSPLITVKGFLGLLEEDLADDDQEQIKEDILRISNAVTRMHDLLDDLLELSRVGRLLNEKENLELKPVIMEVIELLNARVNEKNVKFIIDDAFPEITANYKRIFEIYQNLIENAIKYMGDQKNPVIHIGVKKLEVENPVFFVADNGQGIDSKFHKKIFGLFEKLNDASEGTGIGLALILRIIKSYNGKIWVESEGKGQGSTFYFTLN